MLALQHAAWLIFAAAVGCSVIDRIPTVIVAMFTFGSRPNDPVRAGEYFRTALASAGDLLFVGAPNRDPLKRSGDPGASWLRERIVTSARAVSPFVA